MILDLITYWDFKRNVLSPYYRSVFEELVRGFKGQNVPVKKTLELIKVEGENFFFLIKNDQIRAFFTSIHSVEFGAEDFQLVLNPNFDVKPVFEFLVNYAKMKNRRKIFLCIAHSKSEKATKEYVNFLTKSGFISPYENPCRHYPFRYNFIYKLDLVTKKNRNS